MKFSAKLFLENGDDYVLGPGRIELLRAIQERGSLRKAAEKLGMSYRWAWGRLKNAEKDLQVSLLVRTEEAIGGRPKVLTPEAHAILAWFAETEATVQRALDEASTNKPSFLHDVPPAAPKPAKGKVRVVLD